MIRRCLSALALIGALIAVSAVTTQPASAAAYPKGVYAPLDKGDSIEGWADVNTDCEGTFGCSSYVKIEFLPDPVDGIPPWVRSWVYAQGQWANGGWNKVNAPYMGCGIYRTVVDTYNDAVSDAVFGVNLGVVEASSGGEVKTFHKNAPSSEVRICRYA